MTTRDEATRKDPLSRIPEKHESDIRLLSFNVNGIKTIFHYHPWNQLKGNFNAFLQALGGDIISLQELKIQSDAVAKFGVAEKYKSFVSVPKTKRGYSGVGLYVRIPQPDEPTQVQQALTVVKAEEGVTGLLKDGSKCVSYRDLPNGESIGGYLHDEELNELNMTVHDMRELDAEGRSVLIELANNTVVFALYCPANSMGTSEGQVFRLNFLEVLFRRGVKLHKLGKKVIIMGDINVSPDLIDSAESINELIKTKKVLNNLSEGGETFESLNCEACLSFHTATMHRSLLHRYAFSALKGAMKHDTQFLHDVIRIRKKRELALYTVWNTMTNARQSNFGSRIDLILLSSEEDVRNVRRAEILPFLHGSDHCPVMTDICVAHQEVYLQENSMKLPFEAMSFYKLVKHRDISTLFAAATSNGDPKSEKLDLSYSPQTQTSTRIKRPLSSSSLTYTERKKLDLKGTQQPIGNFFIKVPSRNSIDSLEDKESSVAEQSGKDLTEPVNVVSKFASLIYDHPPLCFHREDCILKTSKTPSSKGKRFWCCARTSKGSTVELGEHRCNFFEWSKKPSTSSSSSST